MTRQHMRRRAKAKKTRPAAPPISDPGSIRAVDSEDQAGTYAPLDSGADTGETDEGVFAQGPLSDFPSKRSPVKRRKEVHR